MTHALLRCWEHEDCLEHPDLAVDCAATRQAATPPLVVDMDTTPFVFTFDERIVRPEWGHMPRTGIGVCGFGGGDTDISAYSAAGDGTGGGPRYRHLLVEGDGQGDGDFRTGYGDGSGGGSFYGRSQNVQLLSDDFDGLEVLSDMAAFEAGAVKLSRELAQVTERLSSFQQHLNALRLRPGYVRYRR